MHHKKIMTSTTQLDEDWLGYLVRNKPNGPSRTTYTHALSPCNGRLVKHWWQQSYWGPFLIVNVILSMPTIDDNEKNPIASEAVYTRNFFSTACRTVCKHAFCFLRVRPEAVSTRHSWLWQTLDDVYTRRCFSESEGTRFGAPGQKALP